MATEIKNVRVAYAELRPFVEIRYEDGKEILEGFMPEIVRSLVQWMDMKVEWIREPGDQYGTWENNTWTGMCGMLFRNEVDFLVNPLMPSDVYAEVAHYTNPVIYEAFTTLSGKQKLEGGFFLYFNVLGPMVWASIGITLIVVVLVSFAVFLRISHSPASWIAVFVDILWHYVACMLRQGPNEKWMYLKAKRRLVLLRLLPLLVTLWVIGVAFLIMTIFQSLLVSKLTIVRSKPVIDSMEEFLAKKHVIGLTPREIELQEALKDSGIQVYEDTWVKLEPELVNFEETFSDETYAGVEEGRFCVFNGKLILRAALSDYFQSHGKCNFHISPREFYPFPLLMALNKNLPEKFHRKFNYGLTRLVDADLTGKWFKPIFETSRLCMSYSDKTLKPLNLKSIYGVLMIWAVGMTSAFIVLIIEKMSYNR